MSHSIMRFPSTFLIALVVCVATHPSGATVAQDGAESRHVVRDDVRPPVTAAALVGDERQVLLGSQAGLEQFALPDLAPLRRFDSKLAHIHDLALSPDGESLLVAGGVPGERGIVEVWSWPEATLRRTVPAHDDLVYRIGWSQDGQRFATASADGRCRVFAAESGELQSTYEGHSRAVLAVAFLADGDTLVSAGADQTIQLWRRDTAVRLRTLDNHVGTVNQVAVKPSVAAEERPVLASVSEDRTVRLWQPTIGRLVRFVRLASIPRTVVWSSDASRLYVGDNDGHVRTIDPDTMQIMSDEALLEGRVHELLVGAKSPLILAAGATTVVRRKE